MTNCCSDVLLQATKYVRGYQGVLEAEKNWMDSLGMPVFGFLVLSGMSTEFFFLFPSNCMAFGSLEYQCICFTKLSMDCSSDPSAQFTIVLSPLTIERQYV
jgi:hypothetical protein